MSPGRVPRMSCADCGATLLVGELCLLIAEDGTTEVSCTSCASCCRCRGNPEMRYPVADGASCRGCLTIDEQREREL